MDSNTIGAMSYGANYVTKTEYSDTFFPAENTEGSISLDVQSFIELLAAQLQNQDMLNPMSDADFMGQLAQITALQVNEGMAEAIETSTQFTATSYASSLMGQEVTAASIDADGTVVSTTGTVTGVSFYEGQPVFYIGEEGFYLSQLMQVGKVPGTDDAPETDTETDSTIPETDETPDTGDATTGETTDTSTADTVTP